MQVTHKRRRYIAVVGVVTAALLLGGCGQSDKDKQNEANKRLDSALKLQTSGQDDRARDEYQKVLDLEPTNKYAIYNLALLDQLAGKNDVAEGKYRVVIKLDPQYEPALYNLGVILGGAGRTDEAIDLYRRAIGSRPNAANAHFNLALLLRAKGQRAAGNTEMAKALSLDKTLKDPAVVAATPKASAPVASPEPSPTG